VASKITARKAAKRDFGLLGAYQLATEAKGLRALLIRCSICCVRRQVLVIACAFVAFYLRDAQVNEWAGGAS
jgi:hypothetical protein